MMRENKEFTEWRISEGEVAFSRNSNFERFIDGWAVSLLRGLEGSLHYFTGVLVIPGTLLIFCALLYLSVKDYAAFRGVFAGTTAIIIIHPLLEFLIHPL